MSTWNNISDGIFSETKALVSGCLFNWTVCIKLFGEVWFRKTFDFFIAPFLYSPGPINWLTGKCLHYHWYLHYIKSERDGPFLKYVNACWFIWMSPKRHWTLSLWSVPPLNIPASLFPPLSCFSIPSHRSFWLLALIAASMVSREPVPLLWRWTRPRENQFFSFTLPSKGFSFIIAHRLYPRSQLTT